MVEMIIIHIWQMKHTNIYQEIIFNDKHLQIFTFNLIFTLFYSIKKGPLIMLCATSRSSSAKSIVKVW